MMVWKKATRFVYWSYSGWTTWVQCAYKAKLKQIDKKPEPGSVHMDRGNVIHKEGEDFVKGKVRIAPKSFGSFRKDLGAFKKLKATAEVTWSFDRAWVRKAWNDWDSVWLRIKVDLHYFDPNTKILDIVDYKTGKDHSQEDNNKDQMDLYQLGAMLMYPDAKTIRTALWYVDHGTAARSTLEVGPKTLAAAKKKWEKAVIPMMNDTNFAKSPSRLCQWCHFRASNGGPCDNG